MPIESLKTLTADPKNRRKHTPRNLEMIQASLAEVGASRSIVIDETGEILAGNGLVQAAIAQGLDRVQIVDVAGDTVVAVRRSGLTGEQKRALAIYDNRTAELAEWDWGQIEADRAAGLPLDPWWTPAELAAEVKAPKVGRTDPDEIPPLGPSAIQRGDLFELGGHRLLCGDATLRVDVGRLMGHDRAAVCLTDPPYGIGLEYDGFDDSEEAVRQMAGLWLPLAREVSDVVTFSPGVTRQWLYPEPDWVLCWFYGGGPLSGPWGFSCWQPFLCYGADPSLARGAGRRPDAVDSNTPANAQDLAHPCPKPVALWSWLLQRLTFEAGAIVLDLFAGAGTGLIAAEQHHRRCFAMEQSPQYCQVAIDRWEAFTRPDGREGELMGRRGPRPTPTVLKLMRGNPGKRGINRDEPKPGPLEMACPDVLTDPAARAEWDRVAPGMIACGQVTVIDRATLIGYCQKWAQWQALEREAASHPFLVRGPKGAPMANPAIKMADRSFGLMLKAAAELGMTPAGRSRVTVVDPVSSAGKWAALG